MTAAVAGGWAGIAAAAFALGGAGAREQVMAGAVVALLSILASNWIRARRKRRRWKEVDRLERSLFAAAGMRRRWRTRS